MYHKPVLLKESIEALRINPHGIYVDLTFGGGGHARAILEKLSQKGHLYAFDQDQAAEEQASSIKANNFTFIRANALYIKQFMTFYRVTGLDGIIADLGVSSHQIDCPQRGFSTRYNGLLDMRMDANNPVTASHIINTYAEKDLQQIFYDYAEIDNAKALSKAIVSFRDEQPIETTHELCGLLKNFTVANMANKYCAKVFQALRIVVNKELDTLKKILQQSVNLLNTNSRFVILTYHSLEDRLVKRFFNNGNFSAEQDKDSYGNIVRPLTPITKKPVTPSSDEIIANKRARSAKMRTAEKM